ncbi:hypothetical protein NLU13_9490 [Sarocladium strictum]|uniref:Methyltransferase domain-containing protein n=1 Tax=Sarocladium strictum TaxID=5046 RepID=A0AA39GAU3_SARSR|nr:hypothetical protein NLU13_9490 [Sarocladium strictum]
MATNMMGPEQPLPYAECFASPEDYVNQLLEFTSSSDMFQILSGGVHIIDFFTQEPGLFHSALPPEWHDFLLSCDIMRLLDLLLRDDLDKPFENLEKQPPKSFIDYVASIRKFSLRREFGSAENEKKLPALPRHVAVGMKPKKKHEVSSFAKYVQELSQDLKRNNGTEITHFVDFGSGQNYLGRALASEPYNRKVVAVEGREHNVSGAKGLDIQSGLATRQVVMRNKKVYQDLRSKCRGPDGFVDEAKLQEAIKEVSGAFDFRPMRELLAEYTVEEGRGTVQYVSGRLDSGELSDVIAQIDQNPDGTSPLAERQKSLMAISIHSCGNLSHYGIRSLLLNPEIHAVAIVGCCYNLLTERLGPPTYKHPYLRPTLQAINGRLRQESEKRDPQGFPMSEKFTGHQDGVRLNITARMMACQAPANWGREESEAFFTRHYYRTVLQRIFLDRGVVQRMNHRDPESESSDSDSPFDISTSPVTIGSLPKSAYSSLKTYVRGVIRKLTTSAEFKEYGHVMNAKMADITDEVIDEYEKRFAPRRKEICVVWTLMSFTAVVVESLIVSDRWTFLQEQADVQEAWVETVFDYAQSPRNLVVVGIKK